MKAIRRFFALVREAREKRKFDKKLYEALVAYDKAFNRWKNEN